jgi:hypothetical protein
VEFTRQGFGLDPRFIAFAGRGVFLGRDRVNPRL